MKFKKDEYYPITFVFSNVDIAIKNVLPKEKGPGFISTPDIIKSFWVTPDSIKRYENIIKVSIRFFVFSPFPTDADELPL